MNFQSINYAKLAVGYACEDKNFLYFFGNRNLAKEKLSNLFPNLNFCYLKQVHKDIVVQASQENPHQEADAHWTEQLLVSPVVFTADCLPILITHPQGAASVHAGWRGVENQIAAKTIQLLNKKYADLSEFKVVVGPHILADSFEVDLALGEKFEACYKLQGGAGTVLSKDSKSSDKVYVDLFSALKAQLNYIGLKDSQITAFLHDTKTSNEFASFRRDPTNTGRNISFVSRLTN